MSAGTARIALLLLAVLAVGGVLVSRGASEEDIVQPGPSVVAPEDLPVLTESAPPVEATGWLNSEPLAPADLQGKVVLYDFWTFGCYNCENTLPWLKAWHARYATDGLVLLSVHTPEFDYEADPDNVAAYVADEGIEYPVALDPEKTTWRAFENRAWPAFYLHDQQGRRRYRHIGEGRYAETEGAIRALLNVEPDAPFADTPT